MRNMYIYIIFALFSLLPPTYTQTTHYFLYLGDHEIPCNYGDPYINVTWYKDSQDISTLNLNGLSVDINGSLQFSNYVFAHAGYYHCENATSGYHLFVECGSNAVDITNQCQCDPGHYRNTTDVSYTCVSCPLSTYKFHPGDYVCFPCPTSRATLKVGTTDEDDCVCIPGYGTINSTDMCVPCPADYYQPEASYTACIECSIYSATPPVQGEADPEGFAYKSDCVCLFTQGNADNSTCYAYATKAVVNISEITETSFKVSFERQLYARAEDGTLQGSIDRYLVEVYSSNHTSLVDYASINDLTDLHNISFVIDGLISTTEYRVIVTSFVRDMEGEPSVSVVTTAMTTTTVTTTDVITINVQTTTPQTTTPQTTTTPSSCISVTPSYTILVLSIISFYLMVSQVYFLF